MSFRCDICGDAQPAGVAPKKIVTATRVPFYGEHGWEVVREKSLCVPCAESTLDAGEAMRLQLRPTEVVHG